ncbi:MAG: hypothetical protein KAH22_08955 [Thiotrichaceae bacterium]|nr:hypothetical protein [Thiotrichaceae bacterium]
MDKMNTSIPLLILGGRENTLAIVRSLGKKGITVNVCANEKAHALRSRYVAKKLPIPSSMAQADYWKNHLLTHPDPDLSHNIIFACDDDSIEFLYQHHAALKEKNYILDDFNTNLHRQLLDKKSTLELARKVGIATPNFWEVETLADVQQHEKEYIFPVILKPTFSHLFQRAFPAQKFLDAENFSELIRQAKRILDANLEFMICEKIPGPDSLLSSYYTYHTAESKPLFHYTKKIIRRFPMNQGGGSFHQSEWLPETAELGKRFFQSISFTGNGNIEFKKDQRDGQYKIIETNTRFTAGHPLLVAGNMDIALSIYCHLCQQEIPNLKQKGKLSYWYPVQDYMAYKELRAKGLINLKQWIKSIITQRKAYPFFMWNDPAPYLYEWRNLLYGKLNSLKNKKNHSEKNHDLSIQKGTLR